MFLEIAKQLNHNINGFCVSFFFKYFKKNLGLLELDSCWSWTYVCIWCWRQFPRKCCCQTKTVILGSSCCGMEQRHYFIEISAPKHPEAIIFAKKYPTWDTDACAEAKIWNNGPNTESTNCLIQKMPSSNTHTHRHTHTQTHTHTRTHSFFSFIQLVFFGTCPLEFETNV